MIFTPALSHLIEDPELDRRPLTPRYADGLLEIRTRPGRGGASQ